MSTKAGTRRALMDAALQLFAARGVAGVGIREIARAAGVSNPASRAALAVASGRSIWIIVIEILRECRGQA